MDRNLRQSINKRRAGCRNETGIRTCLETCNFCHLNNFLGIDKRENMKRKVRTISVNKQKFAWWYSIGTHITEVYLSPFEDKTSKVTVVFPDVIPSLYGQYNESVVVSEESVRWVLQQILSKDNECLTISKENYITLGLSRGFDLYNESIVISRGRAASCIKIVAPKMAGLLLDYCTRQTNMFVTRRSVVVNGYDVLSQMGYHVIEIKKGLYW